MHRTWFACGWICIVALLPGLAGLGCISRRVTVPDVTGMTVLAAAAALNASGLNVGTVMEEPGGDMPEGVVIRQTPGAGERVEEGSLVNLVVSRGPGTPEEGEGEMALEGEGEATEEGEGEPVKEGEGEQPVEGEGETPEGEEELPLAEGPVVDFTAAPSSGFWPLTVSFTDLSESGSVPVRGWIWDFGDGGKSLEQHPAHRYVTPGVYPVNLKVYSDAGEAYLTKENFITVAAAADGDGDGLPDGLETEIGSDPALWDTSGDGFSDGALYYSNADPLVKHGTPAQKAVFIEKYPELQLIEVRPNQLVFAGMTSKTELLVPGNILISSSFGYQYTDEKGLTDSAVGFLREAGSVVEEGGEIIVDTVDAALENVFDELNLEGSIPITLDTDGTILEDFLADFPVYSDDIFSASLCDGRVLLTPDLSYTLIIQAGEVQEFSAVLSGGMLLQLGALLAVTSAYELQHEIPLASVPFPIPSTPLVVTLSASAGFELTLEGQASLYAGFRSQTNMTLGAVYANDVLTSLSSLELGNEFLGPELDVSASLDAKVFLKPKVDIALYGRVGAYVQIRPFLNFDAHYPCPPAPKLDVGIDGGVGVYADLFVWEWAPDPIELFEVRHTLWEGGCWDLSEDLEQVSAPVISPYANTGCPYYVVRLSCDDEDAEIRYTTNGSEPDADSPLYTGPFILGGPEGTARTLKTRAWKTGYAPSETAEHSYVFGPLHNVDEMSVLLPGNVPLVLVHVPAGSFQMGATTEPSREGPVHNVTLAHDFCMAKYELTQRQWLALMNVWPENEPVEWMGIGDDYPMYYISWEDAHNFIDALNAHILDTGQGTATFRLPTEAEWEYACRAGTQTRFYFGDSEIGDNCEDDGIRGKYMWFCGNYDKGVAARVGLKLPNAFGLYDMHGNCWEYCEDDWHWNYLNVPVDGTAWLDSPRGENRVMRGGNANDAYLCTSTMRWAVNPADRSHYSAGFRVVRQ